MPTRPATTTRSAQPIARAAQLPAAGNDDIGRNVEQARKASILAKVASRFGMDPNGFANTLRSTVFKNASNEEFAALLVVADQYGLNPLTKEMYAFPQKGGGIVPLVSIDGWIRIMNDHPQFDGIEFSDIPDDEGKLIAIEAVIYRKDRTRPIRVTEYLEECKGDTGPWKKIPARMLRHRSLIQCARIAFGFSGIYTEDEVVADVGPATGVAPMRDVTPQRQATPARAALPPHDPETGELDDDDQFLRGEDDAGEGRTVDQVGEEHRDPDTGMEVDPQAAKADEIIARAKQVSTIIDYNSLAADAQPHIDAMSDADMAGECNKALREAKNRLTGKAG